MTKRKSVCFVVFCLGLVFAAFGCDMDPTDTAVFDDGVQFHFEDMDKDGDKYLKGTYTDSCSQISDASRRAECMDTLDENGLPKEGDDRVSSETYELVGMLDCDDNDNTVYPGAPELCDKKDNDCDNVVDDGIVCDCLVDEDCPDDGLWCNGAEVCSSDNTCVSAGNPCVGGLLCDEGDNACMECQSDDDCPEQVCDYSTHTCVECTSDTQCDDGLFCTGQEQCGFGGVCLPGTAPCVETVCDEAADSCEECLDSDDCADGQLCDPVTDTCVDCLNSTDCDDGLYCNGAETCNSSTHTCQAGSDPCLEVLFCDEGVNTCVGCVYDSDCAATRPADLGEDYLWGCSAGTPPPYNVHICTSCVDADHDNYCGAETCDNDLDDDGDGVVDELECEPSDICDPSGAWIENVGGPPELVDFDVLYHTYTFDWLLVVPANHLEYPYQNFGPLVLHEGVKSGGDCILGIDVIPSELYTREAWLGMSNTQQQAVCEAHFLCYNASGQAALPVINPADPEHSCFCPYNATPLVP